MLKLYSYWRSSAAYRVRIALNLKGVAYESESVHLVRDGGQQRQAAFRLLNPQGLVPVLVLEDGTALTQSLAIIEYLDETLPEPRLLPGDAAARARARALALAIACDIHPLNNLRVLQYLKRVLGQDQAAVDTWYRHWLVEGLAALEEQADPKGPFLCGDQVTMADLVLVPQLYNARRFDCDLAPYPRLRAADAACAEMPAFIDALPENQPDAEPAR